MAIYLNGQEVCGVVPIPTGDGLAKYVVNQVVSGDSCTLEIITYDNDTNNVYLIGNVLNEDNTQNLYILNE